MPWKSSLTNAKKTLGLCTAAKKNAQIMPINSPSRPKLKALQEKKLDLLLLFVGSRFFRPRIFLVHFRSGFFARVFLFFVGTSILSLGIALLTSRTLVLAIRVCFSLL